MTGIEGWAPARVTEMAAAAPANRALWAGPIRSIRPVAKAPREPNLCTTPLTPLLISILCRGIRIMHIDCVGPVPDEERSLSFVWREPFDIF